MLLGTLRQEARTCIPKQFAQPGQSHLKQSGIWDIQARLHTQPMAGQGGKPGILLRCSDFCRHSQSSGQLQTLIPLSPFLSLPAARGHTPAMQAEGTHAALHSSELFPAMVYQCILTGRSWCPFSSLLLTHSPPRRWHSSSHCTVFIINTQEKHFQPCSSTTGSCFLCYSLPSITTAALNHLSCTTAIKLSVKRGWTQYYFYKCFPN